MNSKYFFLILLIALSLVTSCDYVNEPYTVPGPHGCSSPQPDFTPRTSPIRKVLVEDFTGHRCGNCPRAAEVIVQLETSFGEQVIAIGLHPADVSFTNVESNDILVNPDLSYTYDFRSVTATDIDKYFGVSSAGFPNGMVNRKYYNGSRIAGHPTWSTHVAAELAIPQEMDIQIKNFWNAADNSICSYYYIEALSDINGDYKMCLFLVENDIVAWQEDYLVPGNDISNYTHKHVLRGSLNGSWGTPVNTNEIIAKGDSFVDGYSMEISPANWNINNLYVVGFVYDAASYEVIQAEQVKLIP